MAFRVDLSLAGVPRCDFVAEGETREEVMARVNEHLDSDHPGLATPDLLATIERLVKQK